MNIDLNKTECVRTVSGFLKQKVVNVCNGQVHEIPYGGMDIVLGGVLVCFLATICLVFIVIFLSFIKDF